MPKIKVAFVSTNSITQGEQIGILWQYLIEKGAKIHFAHRTFRWNNEARGRAAVHCVVIGFALFDANKKRLFDYQTPNDEHPHEIECKNISPYLIDSADLIISTRHKPSCDVPEMVKGNQPTDNGYLLFTESERIEFLAKEPEAEKFILPIISAHQFLNGENRFCLWLKDTNPTEWRNLPEVMKRVNAVREFRLKSTKQATVRLADVPYLFAEIRQPNSDYVLIPRHSSENRRYIPMAFFSKDFIVADSCNAVPNASLYLFGVLTSVMHNAWMRQVCGRLESRYRYSNNLVYNNFPFPKTPNAKQIERVEQTANAILDARANFSGATLADLYDANTMPLELVKAHRANDEAVDACYGKTRFKNELERLEFLFDLYRQYTAPLAVIEEKETRKARRKK